MLKIILTFLLALSLISCQKPNLPSGITVPGETRACVGGGCSDAARAQINMEIHADGVWVPFTKAELKGPPLESNPSGTSVWGDFFGGIASFFDPGSVVDKPITISPTPTEPPPTQHPGTVVSGTTPPAPTFGDIDNGGGQQNQGKDQSKGLKGSELDKMVNNIGRSLTAGFDELSGKNNKRRREAKDAKRKINEANAIAD